jgi:putative serine protease PepD
LAADRGGVGGRGGFVGYALHSDNTGSNGLQNVSAGNPKNAAPVIDRSSLASIAKSLQPTVVDVKTQGGEGSGVVISQDGYIVTNNHVVASGTGSTVQVTFNSGKNVTAKIVGTDPKTDLAVLKVDATGLVAASWADSDAVQVGDTVLAIGSPLGLEGTVTAGIISAVHRTIQVGGDQQSQFQQPSATTTIGDAIQTDAPINPGNSGGALVDTNGKIVGINSAIATSGSSSSGNIGVGFAISANKAKSVTDQLIKGGKVSHPYLGISLGDAQNGGASVQSVQAGSPAATAGIQQGDVITKVDSRTINHSEDLVGAIQASSPGAKLTLDVTRNGAQSTVTVTVGDQP